MIYANYLLLVGTNKSHISANLYPFKGRHSSACFKVAKGRAASFFEVDGYGGLFIKIFRMLTNDHYFWIVGFL